MSRSPYSCACAPTAAPPDAGRRRDRYTQGFRGPSFSFRHLLRARPANPLWQVFLFELQPHRVILRGREIAQAVAHAQYIKDRRVARDGDIRVAPLNPDEGRLADGGPLGRNRHGDAPT